MSHEPAPTSEQATLSISGMDCASCVAHVEKAARAVAGVQGARVNLARGRAVVEFDPGKTDAGAVAVAISQSGYPAHADHADSGTDAHAEHLRVARQAEHSRAWLRRAMVA